MLSLGGLGLYSLLATIQIIITVVTTHISSDPITINYSTVPASRTEWDLRMEIAINVFPTEIAFQHELESRKEGTTLLKKNTLKIHTVIKFQFWFIKSCLNS